MARTKPKSSSETESRLVYSTDANENSRCSSCRNLMGQCVCPKPSTSSSPSTVSPVLRLEKAGRAGKTVTLIDQLPTNETYLKELTTEIKKKCGTGGTFSIEKDCGVIEIQGDKRDQIREILTRKGLKVRGM